MSVQVINKVNSEISALWAAPIASQLDLVERELEAVVTSDVPVAFDLSMRLLNAGGKRIRPALLILSALAAGGNPDDVLIIKLAAATELFHMASLVHDDVVDETYERRGKSTANAEWGNKLSVLGGDFLLSKAFSLLAENSNTEIIKILGSVGVGMTESEMLQAESEGSVDMWKANYWRIIKGKTAKFMSICCECGAIISGADSQIREMLSEYGCHLGFAFQITDDILDIVGDPLKLGKDTCTDLMSGKYTLPVLIALDSSSGKHLQSILKEPSLSKEVAAKAAEITVKTGAIEIARNRAMECAEKASKYLLNLPDSKFKKSLTDLSLSVILREA